MNIQQLDTVLERQDKNDLYTALLCSGTFNCLTSQYGANPEKSIYEPLYYDAVEMLEKKCGIMPLCTMLVATIKYRQPKNLPNDIESWVSVYESNLPYKEDITFIGSLLTIGKPQLEYIVRTVMDKQPINVGLRRMWVVDKDEAIRNIQCQAPYIEWVSFEGYLTNASNIASIRVKCDCYKNMKKPEYTFCVKGENPMLTDEQITVKRVLTEQEYHDVLLASGIHEEDLIIKHNICFTIEGSNGLRGKINVIDEQSASEFSYVEVEFDNQWQAKAFQPPVWFGEEVTNDPQYRLADYWNKTRSKKQTSPSQTKARKSGNIVISEPGDCEM